MGWDLLIEDWGNESADQFTDFQYIVFFPTAHADSEDYGYNSTIAFYSATGELLGYTITVYSGNTEESVSDIKLLFLDARGFIL